MAGARLALLRAFASRQCLLSPLNSPPWPPGPSYSATFLHRPVGEPATAGNEQPSEVADDRESVDQSAPRTTLYSYPHSQTAGNAIPATAVSTAATASPRARSIMTSHRVPKGSDAEVVHGPIFHSQDLLGAEGNYMQLRRAKVQQYFQKAMGVDDFLARVEIELCKHGFTGDNSICVLNLCRDEICNSLKSKIERVFGEPFNLHGLGGVLTCGVTGMGAGLSHAPVAQSGSREKYIFFSFPHVAVNAAGELGKISRASRPESHACGALLKVLGDLKSAHGCCNGAHAEDKEEHDMLDPEYSILKHRLERHIHRQGVSNGELKLDELTLLAEEAITNDLELLISHSVDVSKADYAVITGIQIHNWANSFEDDEPSLEFVQPCTVYTVIEGQKTILDLSSVSALTPRMFRILAGVGPAAPTMHGSASRHLGNGDEVARPRSKASVMNAKQNETRYERLSKEMSDRDRSRATLPEL